MSNFNDWRKDFHRAVVDTILRLGAPCRDGESWQLYYDWTDYSSLSERMTHITTIGVDYDKTTYEETNWQEFMGTFHEGDNTVYGVGMTLVLKDGHTYRWRYGQPFGTFLMEVLRYEPPETTAPTDEIKDRDPDVDWDYWASYGWCPTCYVPQGNRCRDMRNPIQMFCKRAHPGRYRGLAIR